MIIGQSVRGRGGCGRSRSLRQSRAERSVQSCQVVPNDNSSSVPIAPRSRGSHGDSLRLLDEGRIMYVYIVMKKCYLTMLQCCYAVLFIRFPSRSPVVGVLPQMTMLGMSRLRYRNPDEPSYLLTSPPRHQIRIDLLSSLETIFRIRKQFLLKRQQLFI